MNKGFTLVELSIVLVIIGLLIGGILVGQSLIESAKMQSFVRQIAQYDALAASFKSKYKALPGDASAFGCTDNISTPANTCNNGAVEATVAGSAIFFVDIPTPTENSLYWKHLSDSGFRPSGDVYTEAVTAATVVAGTNVPEAQIGKAGVAVYYDVARLANYYIVSGYGAGYRINEVQGLTSIDSLAYDSKTDDGEADAGNVVVNLMTPSTDCNTNETYNIDSGSTLVCSLAIKHMSGMSF